MPHHPILLALAFAVSVAGTAVYRRIAVRLGIVATPNARSLHQGIVPRGGGVVVVLVFLAGVAGLYAWGELPPRWFLALFAGGAAVAALGFVDDIVDLSTGTRVLAHAGLALFAIACVGALRTLDLGFATIDLGVVGVALTFVGVMWMINLFNFMDGIDGMAASGSAWFCLAAAAILEWQGGSPASTPLALLGLSSAGFLLFNWPPARIFLGDAGSGFYGYVFSVFILVTAGSGRMSVWTWALLLGYFVGDTTTTLVIRMRKVKRFWGTHRSHAYQNLARVWENHLRMTLLVLGVTILWLTPLALASVHWPRIGLLLALVGVAPVVGFALRYGPLYDR